VKACEDKLLAGLALTFWSWFALIILAVGFWMAVDLFRTPPDRYSVRSAEETVTP